VFRGQLSVYIAVAQPLCKHLVAIKGVNNES